MKRKFIALIAVAGMAALSFKVVADRTAAVVQERDGLSVFAFSRPVSKYDVLGQVKVRGIVKNEKGPHMVELLLEYAKRDYPSAEGIVVGSDFERADVIRFKE